MAQAVTTLLGHVELTDERLYPTAGTAVTLTDAQYALVSATAVGRRVIDATTTIWSDTVVSAAANFVAGDLGRRISGHGFPDGSRIVEVVSESTVKVGQWAVNQLNELVIVPGLAGDSAAQIAAPTIGVATKADTGGTLAADEFFYKMTAITAEGETTASGEASATTTAEGTSKVSVAFTPVSGATGYKLYRGTVTNTQTHMVATATASPIVDLGGTGTAATIPVTNTTGGTIVIGVISV